MTTATAHNSALPSRTPGKASSLWSTMAGGLFLASATLQLIASLQRWVVYSAGWTRTDSLIEDHRFDYFYPSDPWENVGVAAQLFGAGMILLALGVLALANTPRLRVGRSTQVVPLVVALAFGITGVHAVVSGLAGIPSPAQYLPVQIALSLIQSVGLLFLGLRWLPASWSATVSCLFLLGSTLPGYLVATFVIAPALAGYQSYDTTPWTETIVAATTALAGIGLLLAVGVNKLVPARTR
ncbi:hypothetical protein [Cryobacterium aureum]|uniref:hypothetical protein n=1 Tax=Cryobacterium aureum TaxID=995037 RepID=UPI000CF3BE67|nr:hypothetical protein [Cryobacterium aureum]